MVVISTLKTIYAETNHSGKLQAEKSFNLLTSIKQAVMTIPMGLKKMLGLGSMKRQDIGNTPFANALHKNFHGQIGAYAYLLFVLLCFSCIATTSTAYKESSTGWSVFMVIWSTGLAYLTAILFLSISDIQPESGDINKLGD